MNHSETPNNENFNWKVAVKKYAVPSAGLSWWQIINTIVPYFALWVAMVYSLDYSYWITLGLAILASGFLVRIFIIFHDCGHGSYFKSKKLEKMVGVFMGFLVFTPYHKWTRQHQIHHQTVGNLDKRGIGDVITLTVDEYKALSKWGKFKYRMYRNPVVLFIIGPFVLFTIINRFSAKNLDKKINLYTHLTSLALVISIVGLSFLIGFKAFLLIQVPVLYFAAIFGVWLFYVQHQFEGVKWERQTNWDYKSIAMEGSSFLKLPKVLQWFSGNIGFHHIHHLSGKIPNYKLEKCYKQEPNFQKKGMNLWQSLKSINYKLWDEKQQRLVSFRQALA